MTEPSDRAELLPCPFCGGEASLETTTDPDDGCNCVRCDDCDFDLMGGPVGIGWWPTAEAAAAAWNRRATPKADAAAPEGAQGAVFVPSEYTGGLFGPDSEYAKGFNACRAEVLAGNAIPPQPQDAEDAARLQFLIANEFSVRRLSDTRRFVLMSSTGHLVGDRASHTPAEAIDAARAAAKKENV